MGDREREDYKNIGFVDGNMVYAFRNVNDDAHGSDNDGSDGTSMEEEKEDTYVAAVEEDTSDNDNDADNGQEEAA